MHLGHHRQEGSEQPNPGNNLHVSGLNNRVEARDLEEHFSKVGKVCLPLSAAQRGPLR